jgi:hypothetical protein
MTPGLDDQTKLKVTLLFLLSPHKVLEGALCALNHIRASQRQVPDASLARQLSLGGGQTVDPSPLKLM